MTHHVARIVVLLLMALVAVVGCVRRPLYVIEEYRLKVVVKVLWKAEVYPDGLKPSGVTLYVFRDGKFYTQQTTSDVDSCTLQLEPGRYQLYMISQSPEEYGQMEFDDMTDFNNASVSVLETKSRWYTKKEAEEQLIGNPEMMTAGVSEEFVVTDEAVEQYQYYRYQYKRALRAAGTRAENDPDMAEAEEMVNYYTIRVPVYPRSIVSQYWVTIYSDNADVLQSVRASTSGMARTFKLTQDETGQPEGTQFIMQWELTMDDPVTRVGHVDGRITTFGFPNGELPSVLRDSTLNVSALLIDNKTVEDYVFNVGDKIFLEDPPIGYRYLYRLIFGSKEVPAIHPPDVKPPTGGGGFTSGVEEWDEEQHLGVEI